MASIASRSFVVGLLTSSVAAGIVAARQDGDRGPPLGLALRTMARISFAWFLAALLTRTGCTRRSRVLALIGSHAAHSALVVVYLARGRAYTGPGRLPTFVELSGGAVGYAALAVLARNAAGERTGRIGDLAALYLTGLFGVDFPTKPSARVQRDDGTVPCAWLRCPWEPAPT